MAFHYYRRACKKDEETLYIRKNCFYNEGGQTLEQVAHRSCGCPNVGSVQGQIGWCSEDYDLARNVSACGRGIELDDL